MRIRKKSSLKYKRSPLHLTVQNSPEVIEAERSKEKEKAAEKERFEFVKMPIEDIIKNIKI